jgi:hypothetical protein
MYLCYAYIFRYLILWIIPTVSGAWGKATASSGHPGGLLQLRALDFGNGPFANYSVMQVHYIYTYLHT